MQRYTATSKSPSTSPPDGGATPTINESGTTTSATDSGADTGVSTAGVLTRPGDQLGDRIGDTQRNISLRPPKDWNSSSSEGVFQVFGERSSDGFRPSINVVTVSKGPIEPGEYADLLKEEAQNVLEDFELLEEGPREVGSKSAFQLLGRGSFGGRTATIRQVLVVGQDQLWLVSTFTRDTDEAGAFAQMEASLETLEFSAP